MLSFELWHLLAGTAEHAVPASGSKGRSKVARRASLQGSQTPKEDLFQAGSKRPAAKVCVFFHIVTCHATSKHRVGIQSHLIGSQSASPVVGMNRSTLFPRLLPVCPPSALADAPHIVHGLRQRYISTSCHIMYPCLGLQLMCRQLYLAI